MTRFASLLIMALITVSCMGQTQQSTDKKATKTSGESSAKMMVDDKGLSKLTATLKTVRGNIVMQFYPKQAPNTVTRITTLIKQGFYDGIVFHRVVPNFVIQAGDPTGTGRGGSGQNLKAEFNDIQHIKGTVAMARAQSVDSADSQFYIALGRLANLDQKYTVFGQVTKGLDVIEKVQQGDKILSFTLSE